VRDWSTETIVTSARLCPPQAAVFYPHLRAPELASAIAVGTLAKLVSTNQFPTWDGAQPFFP